MYPHEVDLNIIAEFYDDPNTQSSAVHYIGHIRNYERTSDDFFLEQANQIAINMKFPYDEIDIDGAVSSSPNDLMFLLCAHLAELGLMPDYD